MKESIHNFLVERLKQTERSFVIDKVAYEDHLFYEDVFPLDIEGAIKVTPQVLFGKYMALRGMRKQLHLTPDVPSVTESVREEVVVFERKSPQPI